MLIKKDFMKRMNFIQKQGKMRKKETRDKNQDSRNKEQETSDKSQGTRDKKEKVGSRQSGVGRRRKDGKSGRPKVVHPSPRLWMINKATQDKESGEVGKKESQFNLKK